METLSAVQLLYISPIEEAQLSTSVQHCFGGVSFITNNQEEFESESELILLHLKYSIVRLLGLVPQQPQYIIK